MIWLKMQWIQNSQEKSDRSHVVLWAKELSVIVVFLRPLGLRLGADSDQYDVGKYMNNKSVILTSAIKKVDNAAYDMIKDAVDSKFPGGKILMYDVKNDGIGIPKENPNLSENTIKKVNEIYEKMKSGDIKVSAEKGDLID